MYQEETALNKMFKDIEKTVECDDVKVELMALNANNAAVVRRFIKWVAPTACGN